MSDHDKEAPTMISDIGSLMAAHENRQEAAVRSMRRKQSRRSFLPERPKPGTRRH